MRLVIRRGWCKKCGVCCAFCPRGLLEIVDDKLVMSRSSECLHCGKCEIYCAELCIYEEFGDLRKGEEYLD